MQIRNMKTLIKILFILLGITLGSNLIHAQFIAISSGSGGRTYQDVLKNAVGWYIADVANYTLVNDSISVWEDESDSNHDLTDFTSPGTKPTYGGDSVYFDGTGNILTDTFTLDQPFTVYMVCTQLLWNSGDQLFDGADEYSTFVEQSGTTPDVKMNASSYSAANSDMILNTKVILRVVFNGASSKIQVNEETAVSGNYGSDNAGGFTLGGAPNGNYGCRISVNEVIIVDADDSDSDEQLVMDYLNNEYTVY